MSKVWEIVQTHIDNYGVREAEIARRMGTAPQTLNSWKKRGLKDLPDAALILGLARVTNRPYREVLDAVLEDIRYLPEEVVGNAQHPAPKTAPAASPEPRKSKNRLKMQGEPVADLEDGLPPQTGEPHAAEESMPHQAQGEDRAHPPLPPA